jgi:hypothetical protein
MGSCMVVVRYNGWRCKVEVDRSVRSGLAKSRVLGSRLNGVFHRYGLRISLYILLIDRYEPRRSQDYYADCFGLGRNTCAMSS